MKYFSIIFFICVSVSFAYSHVDSTTCDVPESHQFDFWIGEWNINQKILQKDGSYIELKANTIVNPKYWTKI